MADILSTLLAVDRHALEARFWSKVAKSDDGCWLWTGSRTGWGYGSFGSGGRGDPTVKAHRLSWWIETDVWPGELWVLHRCDNPPCVRPDHLFLGTPADNMADCTAKGRLDTPARAAAQMRWHLAGCSWRKKLTHCKHGHEFTPENTYVWPRRPGGRYCRECMRLAKEARRAREKAAA
jgi:hypothetical protein